MKRSKDKFVDLVKNTYRVLLSRGMKGCYVHFMNKETERFFKSRIEGLPVFEKESLMFSDIIKDEEVLLKQIEEDKKFTEYLPVYTLAAACGNFGEGVSAQIEGWIKATGAGRLSRNMFVTKVIGISLVPRHSR